MKHLNGEEMKRWLIFLIFSFLSLNVSAEDTDDAVFIYYSGSLVDCYKADEVEDLSHIASSDEMSEPDILRILANGEEYDYMLSDVDSVVYMPPSPSKFFWIQIASVIQFMTTNLLISKFYTPALVTPYQIAYRYISLSMVIFTIICMPFWNATTDAYERNDIAWIRKANQKMNWMITGIFTLLLIMIILSPWVYQIWIGDECQVPIGMTIMVALYNLILIMSMRYAYFLNGVGALRLQLYMTIMTIIFIPSVYIVCNLTDNILWLIAVMCICVAPSYFVNMIQFHKILNGTATGIWKK